MSMTNEIEVRVERASRSGRMVRVWPVGHIGRGIVVQRRRVRWPEGPSGRALFRPTLREWKIRGWADLEVAS